MPWLVAGASVLALIASAVVAVVVLTGGDGAGGSEPGYQPGGSLVKAGKYKPGKVTNACDAVDLAAIVRLGYPAQGKPLHEEVNAAGTGGSLECRADFENASYTGQADFGWGADNDLFDAGRLSTVATPPANTTAKAIPGLGETAYYTLEDISSGPRTDITATVEAKDSNLFVRSTFRVTGFDIHADRDAVRQAAENQARIMLDRLR
ncbi:hypothetical protein AB0L82_22405 [Nocardia sp. NPDC052001]|uniref:hypothetical protein n=1 Tax=Nocardia sp. NPDC052001 TaxID=3154853 RepID=UPI00343D4E0D